MKYTLSHLLKTLVEQRGSDLHITPASPPRIRIDGGLVPLQVDPLIPDQAKALCYSVLTDQQKQTFEATKELDLAFSVTNLARFRANIYMQKGNVAGAFRVIPQRVLSAEELGLPAIFKDLCQQPRGLVLVTGPTGSGKSTTLAAMIDYINTTRHDHIITIEDPIEYIHDHKNCIVNQRELGDDTSSFANALKSVLRQDPDVVLVGEMRDLETIAAALTTSETGHLVFGTLHTNGCVQTLNRIIDVFPPHQQEQIRTQMSMSLEAVISQTLLPQINGGRCMAMEVMISTAAIRSLIQEGKFNQIYSYIQSGQGGSGMQTLNQSLYTLVSERKITHAVAMSKSSDRDELQAMFDKPNTTKKESTLHKRGA